jgi:fatty-acyl-CoA synthase
MNTIVEMIRNLAQAPRERAVHLHRPAPDPAVVIPYPELYTSIQAHMAGLRAQGVGPGTRVILPFETDERVLCTFLALIGVGALPLSVKPYLFSGGKESYVEFLQVMAKRFRVDRILRTDSLRGLDLPAPALELAGLAIPGQEVAFHDPRPDQPAFVQFSSGTTAFPKGVPIRHDRFLANMGLINGHDHRRAEDVSSSWLPLYHDMGLIGGLLTSFVLPNTAHLYTPIQYLMDPIGWLRSLGQHRVDGTVMPNFGVDYALRYLREADPDDLSDLDFSSLRIIYLGSEPINMDTLDEFCRRMAPYGLRRSVFQPCYGMAEVVLMVTADNQDNPKVHTLPGNVPAVCVGKPLPTFELRVVTEDGRVAGEGELGEIQLGAGTLADGYFEEGRPLAGDNGFYGTGDVGMLRGGALYITGRIGDRMKVNGQSYFASAFEQVVDTLPFVRTGRSAVFQTGDRVVVLAEVQGAPALRERRQHQEQIVATLLDRTGVKVRHEDIHFIRYGQIHKTSSGKLRRQAIAEAHQRGDIRDADLRGYLLDRARMRATRVIQTLTLGLRASLRGLRGVK